MSYNPNRAANFNTPNQRKQYVPKPGEGIHHSDIMRRAGSGLTIASGALRTPTRFGYQSQVFECKDFTVRFEVLFPGNSTAFGTNKLGDRHIRVCRGSVYITSEVDASERVVKHLPVGAEFSAPRGTKYALATSGSEEAELLIVESVGYEKNWKELEEAVVKGNGGVPEVVTETPAVPRNRDSSKEKEYAVAQAIERNKRIPTAPEKRPVNDASASVGVNLRPSGPGSFGE